MLKDKVAIITGGTRGIGYGIAKMFLDNHAKVVIFGSKEETVNKALEELKKENSSYEVIGYAKDLSNESEMKAVFKEIHDKYNRIDILVNNAGVSSSTPIKDYTTEEYERVANLNIKSVYVCSKEIVPYLEETKGTIINTSSVVSIFGQTSGVMYPTSKFAVNGLTISLARELAPLGIRVNAVAPGITNTDMVKNLPKEMIDPLIKTIPLGRIGEVIDVANAFLFLASDMSSYISGEVINVNGLARP